MDFDDSIDRHRWLGRLIASAKGPARKPNSPFELTIDSIESLYDQERGRCAVTWLQPAALSRSACQRSLRAEHRSKLVKRIVDAKAQFRSLVETWADTGTSTGRLMLVVLGGLANVERDLIRTRTAEGGAAPRPKERPWADFLPSTRRSGRRPPDGARRVLRCLSPRTHPA